jgi:pimeloyl-ACP methyl ester carboxylesterase
LIAAARPEIRDEISFLLGIGPYSDLQRCFRWWFEAGPPSPGEGFYPTRFYAKWIIMKAALGMLPASRDRQFMDGLLIDLLLQKEIPAPDPGFTAEGRRWYRLAVMRERQSDNELTGEIASFLAPTLFRSLDPRKACSEVRIPVFLVHGAYDDLIPPEEGKELQQRIEASPCYLLITPFLTHTHPLDKPLTWKQKTAALADALVFFYRFAAVVR